MQVIEPVLPALGWKAGKKVSRKRHIAVDTIGLLLTMLITTAGVQDRDGARPLLWNLRRAFPEVQLAWAGGDTPASWSPGPRARQADPAHRDTAR